MTRSIERERWKRGEGLLEIGQDMEKATVGPRMRECIRKEVRKHCGSGRIENDDIEHMLLCSFRYTYN